MVCQFLQIWIVLTQSIRTFGDGPMSVVSWKVGSDCVFGYGTKIAGDCVIGNGVIFSTGVIENAKTRVGDRAMIQAGTTSQ